MIRSAYGVRIGVVAALLSIAGCTMTPPAPIEPAALLRTENVVALALHPDALLQRTLDGLLEASAWPETPYDAVAIVRHEGAIGWIGFTMPADPRVNRLPAVDASPPSLLSLVGTGAATLSQDAFYRGAAAAAADVRSWAYVAKPSFDAPLSAAPLAVLTDTGALALLWADARPTATASVNAVVPALPARAAIWFADGRVLGSLREVVHPDITLATEALFGAGVLRSFGAGTAPQDLAQTLHGPGVALVHPHSVSGSALLLAGSGRDGVGAMLTELRDRFVASRARMEVEDRAYERDFRSRTVRLTDAPLLEDTIHRDDGWTVRQLQHAFDGAQLITAERGEAFVLGTDRAAVTAFLDAGTGTLSLPPLVQGSQREAGGTLDVDVLPPSLAARLSPLLQPLDAATILWSLDRTGGASVLTLRAR